MSRHPHPLGRIIGLLILAALAVFLIQGIRSPSKIPVSPRIEKARIDGRVVVESLASKQDQDLVRLLLKENPGERRFAFPDVVEAAAGRRVIPLDRRRGSHERVVRAIEAAVESSIQTLNLPDSPVRQLSRINEGSRHFEDLLLERLDAIEGIRCGIPATRDGGHQRSGYPDLRITDEASGEIFYLDPKLVARDSRDSTLRSFYFEPKDRTLKITDDAVHLLLGIGHDGRDGEWTFEGWKLVDLSGLKVRLKAEFQASNADIYPE